MLFFIYNSISLSRDKNNACEKFQTQKWYKFPLPYLPSCIRPPENACIRVQVSLGFYTEFYGIWNLSALWYQKIIFWINEVACLFACFMNILVKYVLYNSPPPRLFTLNYNERSTNLWFIYTSNLSSLKSHI